MRRRTRQLSQAWRTEIADDGEQEASPIVCNGVLALDATTGRLLWHAPYQPSYVLAFAASRGVGVVDGKIFIATQDCRTLAFDAATACSWPATGSSRFPARMCRP